MNEELTPESVMMVKVKTDNCNKFLSYKEMVHIMKGNSNNGIQLSDKNGVLYTASGSMKEFEKKTKSLGIFFRAHNKYIVNFDAVEKFDVDYFHLINKVKVSFTKEGMKLYLKEKMPTNNKQSVQLSFNFYNECCAKCGKFYKLLNKEELPPPTR